MVRTLIAACITGALCIATDAPALDWSSPNAVVERALATSPSLREIEGQLAAARARTHGAGVLPNPMFMAGVQNQQVDLSTDPAMTMYMIGASQTFVRRERRNVLKRSTALDVLRLEREVESRRAEITRDVLVAWNDAAAAGNQIATNEEIARLAATIGEAARIRYEAGFAPQIDIIRAKLEESTVRHELLMQRSRREQAIARLRALIDLPPSEAVPPFALQHSMESHAPAAGLTLNLSTPATAQLDAEVARAEEEIQLARLLAVSDVTIEGSYGFRPQQKGVFSVVARFELPIRKAATIDPHIAEAVGRRDAAKAQVDVLRQQLRRDFDLALAQRNEAIEQINLHVEELVPEAKLGYESALASYQAGKTTFDSVLGALQTYRTLNVDDYDFLRQLLVAEAEIDAIQHGATSGGMPPGTSVGGAR